MAAGEKYIKYHNDGTVWAKATMLDREMHDYREWKMKEMK